MFNNLIESTSHAREFKRRGSFLLFTTATYVVLFVVTGVASIYAYDAHLERQSTEWEIVMFMPPEPPPQPPNDVIRDTAPGPRSKTPSTQPVRIDFIDSISNPRNVPPKVGIIASDVLPPRKGAVRGPVDADPPGPASNYRGGSGGSGKPVVEIPDKPPPPAPKPTPVVPKVIKTSVILNSRAIHLPKPIYPPIAKQTRTQGTVTVQVLIDETGNVISAKAVGGHPFLIPEAQKAALQARFSPTLIGDQPVKVSGMITYNFEMR